ncbi:uncharacterized protein LTHEOB_12660 [Neofusicoccum parvum]|nr:uncharacterized protein LTHEOB_12660 [Neofusicoccum parvum]
MDDCRSPSPPLHFPDIRSTPSPVRRRLPRPLPDPPSRLTFSAISTSSSSSLASSRASTDSSRPEKVLAIIHEIDAALHYTNSTRSSRRQRPAARLPPAPDGTQQPAPPTASLPASPHHPPRLRPASISSYSSVSSSSSAGDPSSPSTRAARTLRRRFSPRDESLREVRARDSDACLQRVYERQLMTYLDGSIFAARPVLQRQGEGGGGGSGRWGGLTP